MSATEQPVGVPQSRFVGNDSNRSSEEYSSSYTSFGTPAAVNQKKKQEKEHNYV